MFRGREVHHPELGKKILDQVAEAVKDVGRVEIFPRIDGRNMTMVLAPDKRAQAAARRRKAAAEAEATAPAEPTDRRPRETPTAHRRRRPRRPRTSRPTDRRDSPCPR